MRWAAIPDTHCPHTDPETVEWGLDQLDRLRPDVLLHLGDLVEAESASKFLKEDAVDLDTEFTQAAILLKQLREASRAQRLILLDGNHDDNVRAAGRLPKEVRSICLPERHDLLGPELRGWERVPYVNSRKGCVWLGQVCFKHGYKTSASGEEQEALQFAEGRPNVLVVGGHSHRPVEPSRLWRGRGSPLHVWYANAGTWGPLQPDWASRDNCRQWGHGILTGTANLRVQWGEPTCRWEAQLLRRDAHETRLLVGGRSGRRG